MDNCIKKITGKKSAGDLLSGFYFIFTHCVGLCWAAQTGEAVKVPLVEKSFRRP